MYFIGSPTKQSECLNMDKTFIFYVLANVPPFFAVWMMGYWSPGVFPFPKEGKDQEEDFLKLPQKKISVDVKSKD